MPPSSFAVPLAVLIVAGTACGEKPKAGEEATRPPPRGTILVSMDTVRADFTTPYGAAADATPSLAALAEEAVVFERAYAPSNETMFSHGALFAGRIASHIAPVDYDFTIPDGTPTLASRMGAAGIRTGAIVAGGHLDRVFGLDDGFDTYTESTEWGSFQGTVPMALHWIDQAIAAGEPFFLFVHSYDAHTAYIKPGVFARMSTPGKWSSFGAILFNPLFYEAVWEDAVYPDFPLVPTENAKGTSILAVDIYDRLPAFAQQPGVRKIPFSAEDRAFTVGTYRSAVFYADLWVGVLMEELGRRGLLDTTTVAVMSDHGEALLDHGFFNHRHTLRDVSTHVPLIVRPAGGTKATRVATPVALLDLGPTLLEMAGATPDAAMEGRSLVPCLAGACPPGRPPYSEGALGEASVTDGTHRLVVEGMRPTDPGYDHAVATGEGVHFHLYEAASGEREDVAGDPANAATIARLREAVLEARRGRAPATDGR